MKTCFKCSRLLPLTEFYAHPQMADGHLNKCKDCTKSDTASRVVQKMKTDPLWIESELARHRIKQARYRAEGRACVLKGKDKAAVQKRHAKKYPEKTHARTTLSNAVRAGTILRQPCKECGSPDSEAHHDDYSKPLEVIWLCPKHHAARHVQLRKEARAKAPNP